MTFRNFCLALFSAFIALTQSSFAANLTHKVTKTDGSAMYRLLPVHLDPAHSRIVQQRLQSSANSVLALPAQYEIPHNVLPPIRDQGQRGSCAYFATVGLLEQYYMAQSPANSGLKISEECLVDVRNWMFDQKGNYTGADKPEQRPDPDGDLPNSIVMTITSNGVPAARKYASADCTYSWDGTALGLKTYEGLFTTETLPSLPYGKGLRFDQNTAPNLDAIKELISHNIPVEVGILVYNDFFNSDSWSYSAGELDKDIAGGHAVMLTGYRVGSSGKTWFTFKNSWGMGWGNSGFGILDDWLLAKSWSYDPSLDFIVSLHD